MRRTPLALATASLAGLLAACGGSGDAASGCSPATADLTVEANDDLSFDAESYDSSAGCIEVTYDNTGSLGHTLLVRGTSGFKLTVGDVATGTVDLAPGTYELFCDIAGHEAGGMKADLVVS
ncbi:MAG: sulfocyanin-like copper-binding protein [Acidimicrobiales bacterium]